LIIIKVRVRVRIRVRVRVEVRVRVILFIKDISFFGYSLQPLSFKAFRRSIKKVKNKNALRLSLRFGLG
jgi:hypothetical protein